jgi:membrane associated rhomboid family serine protease
MARRETLHQVRYETYRRSVLPPSGRVVISLLIINLAVFLLQFAFLDRYLHIFGLVPLRFLTRGSLWQVVTYMFFHGNLIHILFNMLFLWMLGSELERYWGGREFLKYYLVTGAGAGVINVLVQPLSSIPTIGASGAIFGLIIAFGMAFPDREILLYFFIRIKAKHFAVLVGFLELLALVLLPNAPIARFAHLGGLLVGYLYLKRERYSYLVKLRVARWRSSRMEAEAMRRRTSVAMKRHEIDRILDKINTEGMDSLTDAERRFLEKEGGRGA